MPRSVEQRRFPTPWTIEEHNNACFIVRDHTGQALGYFYFGDEFCTVFVELKSRKCRLSCPT